MRYGHLVEYADNISQSDQVVVNAKNYLKVGIDAEYAIHDPKPSKNRIRQQSKKRLNKYHSS